MADSSKCPVNHGSKSTVNEKQGGGCPMKDKSTEGNEELNPRNMVCLYTYRLLYISINTEDWIFSAPLIRFLHWARIHYQINLFLCRRNVKPHPYLNQVIRKMKSGFIHLNRCSSMLWSERYVNQSKDRTMGGYHYSIITILE